jgi:hypothetical protein
MGPRLPPFLLGSAAAAAPALPAPTYSLDFTAGNLPSAAGFAFARTGPAWFNGIASADGVPRIDSSGLLIEGARTNLFISSADLSLTAGAAGTTVTVDQELAPDGTMSADFFDATSSGVQRYRSLTTVEAQSYALSAWLRRRSGNSNEPQLRHLNSATAANSVVNPNTTALARYSTVVLGRIGGGLVDFGVRSNAISTSVVWGLQVENAPFASSYIPTPTGAAVTRNAETCLATRAAGTLDAVTVAIEAATGLDMANCALYLAGSSGNRAMLYGGTNSLRLYTGTQNVLLGSLAASSTFKVALRVQNGNFAASLNGAPPVIITETQAMGFTAENLGSNGASSQWFGRLRKVTRYPAAATDAQLMALSA